MSTPGPALQFVPFQSTAEPSFWMALGEHKLDTLKLSEDPLSLRASFGITSTIKHRNHTDPNSAQTGIFVPGRMRLDEDSIRDTVLNELSNEKVWTKGKIQILNTIESFKKINKNELLKQHCLEGLKNACGINGTDNDEEPGRRECIDDLTQFFCLCHLDLKTHKVVYWFAFPVLAPAPGKFIRYHNFSNDVDTDTNAKAHARAQLPLKEAWGGEGLEHFYHAFGDFRIQLKKEGLGLPSFFMAVADGSHYYNKCLELTLENYSGLSSEMKNDCVFAFLDPTSTGDNHKTGISDENEILPVGWTLRNLVAFLTLKLRLKGRVTVISYRPGVIRRIEPSLSNNFHDINTSNDSSLLLNIQLPQHDDYLWKSSVDSDGQFTCMGWELNARSKPGPRSVNLAPLLSPAHLAQQATDLNLKLMKWRMIPSLNLDYLSKMNVLLLGAGTLGCSVARTLLGWGVRHFRFVDNGKVSYSNPVRQNLFEVKDCEGPGGGKDKAIAAAEALKRIAGPTIDSEGHVLTIPMPGHAFSTKEEPSIQRDVEKIQELVNEADVIFLLTDTRESRWLPTVMARASGKMLINAALGLDSWLVMRHGGNGSKKSETDGCGFRDRLGCYFCNDVVAPENSTNNRTLDQQCTVTRPGLAPIASSMAVELCVSLLHHEEKHNAPAPSPMAGHGSSSFSPTVESSDSTSPLGVMPHQIRGSIVSYTMMTPTVPAFNYCTGCCDPVVDTYRKDEFSFVKRVCNCTDGSFLEDTAGLTAFRAEANKKIDDCLDWDEDSEGDEF